MRNKITVISPRLIASIMAIFKKRKQQAWWGNKAPDMAKRDENWCSLWAVARQIFKRLNMERLCRLGIPPLGTFPREMGMCDHRETVSQTSVTVIHNSPRSETAIVWRVDKYLVAQTQWTAHWQHKRPAVDHTATWMDSKCYARGEDSDSPSIESGDRNWLPGAGIWMGNDCRWRWGVSLEW